MGQARIQLTTLETGEAIMVHISHLVKCSMGSLNNYKSLGILG